MYVHTEKQVVFIGHPPHSVGDFHHFSVESSGLMVSSF